MTFSHYFHVWISEWSLLSSKQEQAFLQGITLNMNGVGLEKKAAGRGGVLGGVFFSTVLETNTVNKVKGKREGWVYITGLQRTSISSPFHLKAQTLRLYSSYSLMCREKQTAWLRATSVSDTWARHVLLAPSQNQGRARQSEVNSHDPADHISEHPVWQQWQTHTLTQRHQRNHKNKSKATQMSFNVAVI